MKNVAFIGLGKQNTSDHLRAALSNPGVRVVAVCDSDPKVAATWGEKLDVAAYTTVKDLIQHESMDAAIVAVPHFAYFDILEPLMQAGVHILKEKPFAASLSEARKLSELAEQNNVNLTVAVQRKHNKIFQTYAEYASRIGSPFSIHGEYTLNIEKLDEGWRASKKLAGGGAVIDMGYHIIDLITWYFGLPDRISSSLGYRNRPGKYDVEDTAKIQFSYAKDDRKILGSLLLSRIYPEKDEGLFIYGSDGAIKIYKDKIDLFDKSRELVESKFLKSDGNDVSLQFNDFIAALESNNYTGNHRAHLANMIFIDAIYESDSTNKTIMPREDTRYDSLLGKMEEVYA